MTDEKALEALETRVFRLSGHQTEGQTETIAVRVRSRTEELPQKGRIVFCIDISASMNQSITISLAEGQKRQINMSRLELVVHSVKSLLVQGEEGKILPDDYEVAVVTFSEKARVFVPPTLLREGRGTIVHRLDDLYPTSSTNLWAGLKESLELFQNRSGNNAIILLTDGVPTEPPPGGHLACLREMIARLNFRGAIHVFGFGSGLQINTELLAPLAEVGGGNFGFIPDSSVIASNFGDTAARILTSVAFQTELELPDHFEVGEPWPTRRMDGRLFVSLGTMELHQSKVVTIRSRGGGEEGAVPSFHLGYYLPKDSQTKYGRFSLLRAEEELPRDEEHRLAVVHFLSTALPPVENPDHYPGFGFDGYHWWNPHAHLDLEVLGERLRSLQKRLTEEKADSQLLLDITGQMTLALSRREWFNEWGRHWFKHLLGCHLHHRSLNKFDPGTQNYGGPLFQELRLRARQLFKEIELSPEVGVSAEEVEEQPGCLAGKTLVHVPGGYQRLDRLKKGDEIWSLEGGNRVIATVLCVVELNLEKEAFLSDLGWTLLLTPYHPVVLSNSNKWRFPQDISLPQKRPRIKKLYDLVLDRGHLLEVGKWRVPTLGHSFTGPVISHPFFGSERVIQSLKCFSGFEKGLISLRPSQARRDAQGLVTDFVPDPKELWDFCLSVPIGTQN